MKKIILLLTVISHFTYGQNNSPIYNSTTKTTTQSTGVVPKAKVWSAKDTTSGKSPIFKIETSRFKLPKIATSIDTSLYTKVLAVSGDSIAFIPKSYFGGGGGGSGTVTSVSVTTANGVSGTVANATTTPAISLSLGAITPTSVNNVVVSGSSTPSLLVVGTSTVSGSNTGDQTSVTGNSGTATALQTARTIGAATGDVTSSGSSFDGTANNTNAYTIANNAVTNAKIADETIDLTTKVTGILPLANGGTGTNYGNVTQELGTILNPTLNASASSLYTDVTPSTTVTFTAGGITLSGGNNDPLNYIYYTSYTTNLQYWTRKMNFTPTSDGNGVGLGLEATVGKNIGRMIATGANKGKVLIDIYTSSTVTNRVTSSTALSYTNGDNLELQFIRTLANWVIRVRNVTTSSDWIFAEYNDPMTYGSLGNTWNAARSAIYHYGGGQTITTDVFSSQEKTGANICVIGTSIPSGFYAGSPQNMYTTLLGKTTIVSTVCGGGNVTGDYTNLRTQFLSLKPKMAVWELGINDIRTSVSEATILSNLRTFITDCNNNGIVPVIQQVLPVSSTYTAGALSNATIQAAITSLNTAYNSMGVDVIPAYANIVLSGSLNPLADAGDGLHINEWGNRVVYNAYISTFTNLFPNNNSLNWQGNISGWTTTQTNNTASIWKLSNPSTGTSSSAQLKVGSDVAEAIVATYPSTYSTAEYQNRTSVSNGSSGINLVASGASGTMEFCTGSFVSSTNSRLAINNTTVTVKNANLAVTGNASITGNLTTTANTSSNFAATITNSGTGNASFTVVNNVGAFGAIGITTSTNPNIPNKTFVYSTNDITLTNGVTNYFTVITTSGSASIGNVGVGVVTPTAKLHLAAGTATANTAPLKLTSGTNLTTAETGAIEYNGTNLFFTRSGTTRENVITTSAVNTVSPTSPNRTLTVVINGTTYYISAKTTND